MFSTFKIFRGSNGKMIIKKIRRIKKFFPTGKAKEITHLDIITENMDSGIYCERFYGNNHNKEIIHFAYELLPSKETVMKNRHRYPRIKINFSEEEMEYKKLFKEAWNEQSA